MPHTPETSSTFAEASADMSASANTPSDRQSILDQISEIQDEAKKNKVKLTPEVQAYIREHLEVVQQKLVNKEEVTEDDLKFMQEARLWVDLPKHLREKYSSIQEMNQSNEVAEVKKLKLKSQYSERLITLQHYGFLAEAGKSKEGDVTVPSYEKAMSTFKPEELEIASRFQKPVLLLVPETSFAAKVKALDAHKQGIQEGDTYVNDIYTDSDSGSEKITGWRVFIVDGAQEMETYEGDNLDLRFDKRIKNRKTARKPDEKGMDRHRYALLMMEAIKNGDPVDKRLYILLDDDPALSASYVPRALFGLGVRGVSFGCNNPDLITDNARFRSSVGGDVFLT